MAACPQCDVCLHSCKLADHVTNICPETVIPCINSIYGCKKTTKRRLHWTHFEHCPAWITQCVFFYERLPVWSEKSCMEPDHPFDLPDAKFLLDDLELMSMTDSSVESECSGNQRKYQLFPSNVATISMNLIRADKSMWRLHAIGCKNYFNDGGLHSTQGYYRHTRIRNSSSYTPIYVFSCGQFIRRDEVSSHYHNHNDFATEGMSLKICGCPLRTYGCPYRTVQYTPSGSMLDYHSHAGSFVLRPQQIVVPSGSTSGSMYEAELTRKQELAKYGYNDWEGSLDYLGQLPVEILILIMEFLDSLSLWCLSQVNQYLRSVAREVATSKGIVYMKWNKCDSKWKQGPKVRCSGRCLWRGVRFTNLNSYTLRRNT